MTIAPITASREGIRHIATPERGPGEGFSEQMIRFLEEANTEIRGGEKAAETFAAGTNNNIHETMIAMERASIALNLVGSVRNRILEAYNEVMRMSV
jgi:flagellar hook-basal body complex protein FliE